MAAPVRKGKPPSVIDKFSDIDFQTEAEILCNFLRWDTFPRSISENFKLILEQRAKSFCVEEYIPTDNASPALPWQLFYTGSPESTGDEQLEDLLEAEKPSSDQDGDGGSKRLVIPHPRQQLNILRKIHEGEGGVHLATEEMREKVMPEYYWRLIGTSITDFIKNCEMCKLHQPDPGTSTPTKLDDDSSQAIELAMEDDDDDDSFENFQLSKEIPYPEEVSQVYNYLKKREYPANSTPNYKRGLRRKAEQYVLADNSRHEAADALDIVMSRKLYYLKAGDRRERRTMKKEGTGDQQEKDWCKRLVIPFEEDQQKILKVAHIGASGAHHRRDKMLAFITRQYYWRGIYQSVLTYLESCSWCQTKMESRNTPKTSLEQPAAKMPVKRTPKRITSKDRVTRSTSKAYNILACQKQTFSRKMKETFNYLKDRSYPPDCSISTKRAIRRRSENYTLGESAAEEWSEFYGHSDPGVRLYYHRSFHRVADQEDDDDDDDDEDEDADDAEDGGRRIVVTTEKEQNVAIMKAHVDEEGIHNTRNTTLNRLGENYFWMNMKTSVNEYIDDCKCTLASPCRKMNKNFQKVIPATLPLVPPSASAAPVAPVAPVTPAAPVTPVTPVPSPEKETELPPLPQYLTDLPKGLSSVTQVNSNTEVEALIIYLYMKWKMYPPECSASFKRMVRRKSKTFLVHEEAGGEDGENSWRLYYKGDSKESKWAGKVMEAEETAGDGPRSMESVEAGELGEPRETEEAMGTAKSKETTDTPDTLEAMKTSDIEITPVMTKKPSSLMTFDSVRNRLFVFRKPDQEKILHHVHVFRGKKRHAGRDVMVSILGRHFYWHRLRDDAILTIKKCRRCQLKRTSSEDYSQYLQEVHNGEHMEEAEYDFEDQSLHELTPHVQAYVENALRLESKWEAEERAARIGITSDFHSDGSMNGGNAFMDVLEGGGGESRVLDGDTSYIGYHQCESCPRRFGNKNLLHHHKTARHSGKTSSPCSFCGKVFKTGSELKEHIRSHTKEKPYECEYCMKRFGYRGGLTRHRKSHFGLKPFTCKDCPQRFLTRSDLNRHYKIWHEGEGDHHCDLCEKTFGTPVRLAMHKKRHLSRQSFICDICGKVLASAFSLKFHMQIHTGEKRVLCELCGKKFKKKDDLSKHMRRHLGIRPHQCHICQQKFALKSDLLDHLRSHEGASLYQCEVCSKKFKNRRSMARCIRRHKARTREEGFQCNTCAEILGTLVDFTQHMEGHVGNKIQEQHMETYNL